LHEKEQPFNCCEAELPIVRHREPLYEGEPQEGHYIVWLVLGFGGKPNPLVFARAASFAARTAQALLDPDSPTGTCELAAGRVQVYVDDPIACFMGTREACATSLDIVVAYWLVLGLPLAWGKGLFTRGQHTWIGGDFTTRQVEDQTAGVVSVPPKFASELFDLLEPMARGTGHLANTVVEKTLGKGGRLAFLIPSARPFVASLWAALAGSRGAAASNKREAPPGRHAVRRFRDAARWLRTLLRPPSSEDALLPLEHLVLTTLPAIQKDGPSVQVDASLWGGGAVLFLDGSPESYVQVAWSEDVAARLNTSLGDPAGQTTWEYLMMLLALMVYGSRFSKSGLVVFGDSLAALGGILNLKGRNGLTRITREVAWRRVRYGWRYAVSHLPAEFNILADALSRIDAPSSSERKAFPDALRGVVRIPAPSLIDLWACD